MEIVRGPATTDQTVAAAGSFAASIEKVSSGPRRAGLSRQPVAGPYLGEAMELLLEGAAIEQIERAATGFGMALGPLRLADEIGLDTLWLGGRVLWQAFPDRIAPLPLLIAMYKAQRLGRKVGRGFFVYRQGIGTDEPGCAIRKWRRSSPSGPRRGGRSPPVRSPIACSCQWSSKPRGSSKRKGQSARRDRPGNGSWPGVSAGSRRAVALGGRAGAATPCCRIARVRAPRRRVEPTPLLLKMAREESRFHAFLNAAFCSAS